ncbi:hypothetical protein SCALM49S_05277 [Streptomyces californicus]
MAGKPTSPSAPPVTDLSWLTTAPVSSPTASVIIRTVVPRARITAGPTTAANTAAASADGRLHRADGPLGLREVRGGVRAHGERRGLPERRQPRVAGEDGDADREQPERQRGTGQRDAVRVQQRRQRDEDREQHERRCRPPPRGRARQPAGPGGERGGPAGHPLQSRATGPGDDGPEPCAVAGSTKRERSTSTAAIAAKSRYGASAGATATPRVCTSPTAIAAEEVGRPQRTQDPPSTTTTSESISTFSEVPGPGPMIGAPSTPAAPASAPAAARTPVCTARGLWPVAASISGSSAAARTAAPSPG